MNTKKNNRNKNIETDLLEDESENPIHEPTQKKNSIFGLNLLQLVTGSSIAAMIGILVTPILTRLYSPEAFGLVAIFISITAIFGTLACMRYEMSIVLPENDQEAANLLGVSLGFSFIVSLLTVPLVFLSKPLVVKWFKMPELSAYLWLLPVSILIHGVFTALIYWNTRTKNFLHLSIAKVTNQLTANSTSLGLGLSGQSSGGIMIIATIVGKVTATALLVWKIWRENGNLLLRSIHVPDMLSGVRRYKKFPLYGSWSILLGVGSWQLPALMMSSFFSPAIVGFYTLGFRILQLPMNLVGNAIGQVFFQSAAKSQAQGSLAHLVENLFHQIVKICLFPMLMLSIIGKEVYIVIFGSSWAEAGVYTQILSIWAFFWFLSGPFTTIFAVLEKQELQLKWNILNFVSRFISILVGGHFQSPRMAIWLLAISGIAIYGYKVFLTLHLAKASIWNTMQVLMKYALIFAPAGACVLVLIFFDVNSLFVLLAAGIFCIAYIYIISYHNFTMLKTIFKKTYVNNEASTIGVQGE